MPRRPIEFSLIPPRGWHEIAIEPELRGRQIDAALASMKPLVPEWNRAYPRLRQYLAGAYGNAWEAGVRYAITLTPDDTGVTNFYATYMVSVIPGASTGDLDDEYDAIVTMLANERQELKEDESLSMERLRLPHFPLAIQAPSVRHVVTEDGTVTPHRMAILRIFIPFDGRMIVVTGTTPQLDVVDAMFTLFVRITETLQARVVDEKAMADGSKAVEDKE